MCVCVCFAIMEHSPTIYFISGHPNSCGFNTLHVNSGLIDPLDWQVPVGFRVCVKKKKTLTLASTCHTLTTSINSYIGVDS